jgi:hypothetical protein
LYGKPTGAARRENAYAWPFCPKSLRCEAARNGIWERRKVRMELCVNAYVLSIGQFGPDFVILENPKDHPPADTEIAVWINGREKRWNVLLPDGIKSGKSQTKIA